MKKVCVSLCIVCQSGFAVLAQTNESAPRLTGIINLPDFKRVLLESPGPPRGEGQITLSEGERRGRVEVLTINNPEGSVDIVDAGKKVSLRIGDQAVSATETGGSNLRLSNADLGQVFDVYARISGRTVLQHPALKATPLALNAAVRSKPEAVLVLEQLFQQHGMASIPDGSKFVMIVPLSLTNTITARSSEMVAEPTATAPLPMGAIDFQNADLRQAIAIYGRWLAAHSSKRPACEPPASGCGLLRI